MKKATELRGFRVFDRFRTPRLLLIAGEARVR